MLELKGKMYIKTVSESIYASVGLFLLLLVIYIFLGFFLWQFIIFVLIFSIPMNMHQHKLNTSLWQSFIIKIKNSTSQIDLNFFTKKIIVKYDDIKR